jgi:hypothetical protein
MISPSEVKLTDSFWLPKIETIQNTTIAFGFDKCEKLSYQKATYKLVTTALE